MYVFGNAAASEPLDVSAKVGGVYQASTRKMR